MDVISMNMVDIMMIGSTNSSRSPVRIGQILKKARKIAARGAKSVFRNLSSFKSAYA